MTTISDEQTAILRTERGLSIAGTRITLYDIMDYVTAQYPPKFIRGLFDLTEEQINAALAYIEEIAPMLKLSIKWCLRKLKNCGFTMKKKIAI